MGLIFNSLLCIFYSIGLLAGVYTENWKIFAPYLISGNVLWFLILASILNILLAVKISEVKKSYGLIFGIIIASISAFSLLTLGSLSFSDIFTKSTTDVMINLGRFFLLSGIALFIVEIPNLVQIFGVTQKIRLPKNNFIYKLFFLVQLAMIFATFYLFFAVTAYMSQVAGANSLANLILTFALLFTAFISFGATILKTWLK